MSEGRRDALCALLLVAIGTLFFADVVFRGTNFHFRDVYAYHMPIERAVRTAIERGELPLWNPFTANGQPMAANPAYEVFYPPQWLTYVGPFLRGFALHVLLHVYLALLGMYAMLRALTLGRPASMFGALSFGLGGFLLGTMAFLPTFFAWAWAPIIGWTMIRLLQTPSRRRFAAAAGALAMPLLILEPFSLLEIGAMAPLVCLLPSPLRFSRRLQILAAVALFAALLAAVQLVPLIDFVRDSVRQRGLPLDTVLRWSMEPLRPLELFAPRVFGTPGGWHWRGVPYLVSLYAGVFVVVLAIAGWIARARGALVAAVTTAGSYVLAIGSHTPLWDWLYRIGVRSLRYPEKFAAMGIVAMIIFAAGVVDAIDRGDAKLRRIARIVAGVVSVALLCPRAGVFALVIGIGWAAVLFLPRPAAYAMALVLLVVDFAPLSLQVAPRLPASFFTRPPLVDALDRDVDAYALFHRGEWAQQADARRFLIESPPWFTRNALRPNTPVLWGLRTALDADGDETELTVTHQLFDAMRSFAQEQPHWAEPFMALANVRYVFDYRPLDEVLREAKGHLEFWRPVRIRRAPGQGRFWFARALVPARDQEQLLAALRHLPDVRGLAFVPWTPFVPAPARLVGAAESTNGARLDVEATGRSLLVITITRNRWWRATIDGAPAELLPANVAFQALVVPAGRHRIELRYWNPMVAAGAAVSLLALLGCLYCSLTTTPSPSKRILNPV